MRAPHTFYRIDFFRVALQVRGASPVEIEQALLGIEKMAKSPAAFTGWNQKLSEKEVRLLGFILTPEGEPLSLKLLKNLVENFKFHFGVTDLEFEAWIKPIREGLN